MKSRYFVILSLSLLGVLSACTKDSFKEMTEIPYTRCLQPTEIKASVSSVTGKDVTVKWNTSNSVEKYVCVIADDPEFTSIARQDTILPEKLPYTVNLVVDHTYYLRVRGINSSKEDSKWGIYVDDKGVTKAIKTYAVMDPLYLAAGLREKDAVSFSWSKKVADRHLVDKIWYGAPGCSDEEMKSYNLTPADTTSCTARISGLKPSTEYQFTLRYKTASRGQVTVWTMPDPEGTVEVSTDAALQQGIKDGAKMLLKAEGSPYTLSVSKGFDADKGFSILGEACEDGTRPVIIGAVNITDAYDGGDITFEGVEFNGNSSEGFAIQKKEGSSTSGVQVGKVTYRNCKITGYTKGLFYEWSKAVNVQELTYDHTVICNINPDGTGGGDGVDLRNASNVSKIAFMHCTVYNGFRTLIRIDQNPTVGSLVFENNLLMNLCFVDNKDNGGIFGIQKAPGSFSVKKNIFLNMVDKATLVGSNTKYKKLSDMGISAQKNYWYNIDKDAFETDNGKFDDISAKERETDPCYNAKAEIFNLTDRELVEEKVGPSTWWATYSKEPEDLTLNVLDGPKTWDLTNAKSFSGTAKEPLVREDLMVVASQDLQVKMDGALTFKAAALTTKKGVPQDGYLRFKVNSSGSVILKPSGANTSAHFTVGTCAIVDGKAKPSSVSVKGGASPMSCSTTGQKIVISDITGPTMVLVYPSGALAIDQIAWSTDSSAINTALPAPKNFTVTPESQKTGEGKDVTITWDPVENAGSYSVVFKGKTYPVEEGLTEYTIDGKIIKMLEAGAYQVSVYANPAVDDIYNTMSEAGAASFAVVPDGGEDPGTETIVKSVQELSDAISAGKIDITLAYNAVPYELGTLALTAPLRLKGQASDGNYPTVRGTIALGGEIGGSVIFTNINFDGTGVAESIIKETDVVTADTIAVIGGVIRNYTKALYDNSGKKASSVQHLIFDDIQVYDCSNASDFIDMRAGAYHNLQVTRSTFARSARTFIRTDAASEINNVLVRNNTFYKVCTISDNKDNNGLFHIRGTAGSGIQQYKIQNNLFYSILITETPANPNGYPKFISKNAAAIKPSAIMNNYFYNIQEDGDYSWWTVNCSKDEGVAGGGCILPADPCKNVSNDDFTLTNGVAMNAGVGDPRWNPAGGGTPTSEITVDNANDFLTAISAGKKTITLSAGTYDLTAITEVEALTAGVLSITGDLSLIGKGSVTFIGGFKPTGDAIRKFSATGIKFDGNGTIGNFIDVSDATVAMSSISIKDGGISNYANRIYSQSVASTLSSLVIDGIQSYKMGTGGDCIDIRKGTISSIKVTNSTFANGIRTFLRVDKDVICSAITVKNNTFYNLCAVDSKDNNGIMHVRSTTLKADTTACRVEHNLFASMHRAAASPTFPNGFPKLVSTTSQAIFEPHFNHNYYYDIETDAGYSWWNTLKGGQATGCQGYGIVLTATPFADAASGDFTLTDPLVMSENIGDPRWNPSKGGKPGDAFAVSSVEDMLTAIAAGKTNLSLAYGTYDFTAATSEVISSGVLTVGSSLTLTGKAQSGKYPEIVGAFKLTGTSATTSDVFTLSNLYLNGNGTIGNMIDIDPAATLGNITLRSCNVSAYSGRLVSQSGASTVGSLDISGLLVKEMGTGGDFIDFRNGKVVMVSVTNSTFYNGIRTFLRMDAAVNCGSVLVKNNTFYNLCAVDNKDNNGIMHVRSSSLTAAKVKVEKNIFASMHRAEAAPAQTNGFPKLVSTASQKVFEPTFIGNIYFDFETDAGYSWWNTLSNGEATGTADGGAVLTETPFSADPATGKFTVKAAYKGYGDLRW